MLDLAEIPFFAALAPESIARIRERIPVQRYAQGEIIARVGEPGRYFQAVASGAVRVQSDADAPGSWRGFILGPGQIFGEMSLFTGMPVAATLVAVRDTLTYRLDGDAFLRLLDEEPVLHRSLTRLLIDRLRHRTRNDLRRPGIAVLTTTDPAIRLEAFAEVLMRGIRHYAPASERAAPGPSGATDPTQVDAAIARWRREAAGEQYLLIVATDPQLRGFAQLLLPEDVVLDVTTGDPRVVSGHVAEHAGAADFSRVFIGARAAREAGRWAFVMPPSELETARGDTTWQRSRYPVLDHVARYVTFSEVGIALSSGAARGFAHVGVLEALEAHDVPVDFLCGTSMGGIAALTVARAASAAEGGRLMREFLGGNRKIRDTAWLPRASIFNGGKVARAARDVFGARTFADLRIPTAVVASDLTSGERAIIDSGPVVPAVLGTSAIPGFFPPIAHGTRMLVDGAIVSRVPVDALARRRCGIRIAVNVVAVPSDDFVFRKQQRTRLQNRIDTLFGFKHVFGASWEMLGSYGSTLEALRADIVITPETHQCGGPFDFDRYERMIECGRAAAIARIDAIRDTVRAMLGTGYR
ncbi:MAG: patatin-like phospholipase family protein [Gammaproteobacteria bacterium]